LKSSIFNAIILVSLVGIGVKASASTTFSDEDNSYRKSLIAVQENQKYLLNILSQGQPNPLLYDDIIYQKFLSDLKFQKTPSLEVTRILKLASSQFENHYKKESDEKVRRRLLLELDKLSQEGIAYCTRFNNVLVKDYFLNISRFVGSESYEMAAKSDTSRTAYVPDKKAQIDVLKMKIDTFVKRVSERVQSIPEEEKFRGTKIEISFRDLHVKEKSENISYLFPRNSRPKVFSIKILEPSVDSSEAVLVATQALLDNGLVEGVFFDDRLRIPSKLNHDSYETSFLGSNILLKRRSCSKLFQ
jgi:hypothetical protein